MTSSEIGKAIGRSRRTVDPYIAELRVAIQMDLDLKIWRMNLLGIPQERIAKSLDLPRQTISGHLTKMPELANSSKADLSRGYTVSQVAEKPLPASILEKQCQLIFGKNIIQFYDSSHKCSIEIISYDHIVADPGLSFSKVAGGSLLGPALFFYQKLYSAGRL